MGLVQERRRRMGTIRKVLMEGDWLTAEQLNAFQPSPPANGSYPTVEWKRRGLVFSVNYRDQEYFARYQFDALYQPLPIIRDILSAFGETPDTWTLAAWFHYPSRWLVRRDGCGAVHVSPKDALDRPADVLRAASQRLRSYVA